MDLISIYVHLARAFLFFNRVIGITFNGLSIDSKGKLSINRFFKIFGYLFILVNLFPEIFSIVLWTEHLISKRQIFSVELGHKNAQLITHLAAIMHFIVFLFKLSLLTLLNLNGNKLMELFLKDIRRRESPRILRKITLVIILWFIRITTFSPFIFLTPSYKDTFLQYFNIISFIQSCLYTGSFTMIIYIISIYYSSSLDVMIDSLKNCINANSS